jgi:hypothetical protein
MVDQWKNWRTVMRLAIKNFQWVPHPLIIPWGILGTQVPEHLSIDLEYALLCQEPYKLYLAYDGYLCLWHQ